MPISNKTYISVTSHAIKRMRERFRLYYSLNHFESDSATRNLIIQLIRTGTCKDCWKRVPFYRNMLTVQYGLGQEIFEKDGIFFLGRYDDASDRLIITTIVKQMLYYKSSPDSVVITTSGGARWVHKDKAAKMLTRSQKMV